MSKLPNWEDLNLDQQLLVLNWARDAIDSGMKKQVEMRVYQAFVQVINGKRETFDLSQVWLELPTNTRQHFEHAAEILLSIDDAIALIEESFDDEDEDEPPQIEEKAEKVPPVEVVEEKKTEAE